MTFMRSPFWGRKNGPCIYDSTGLIGLYRFFPAPSHLPSLRRSWSATLFRKQFPAGATTGWRLRRWR